MQPAESGQNKMRPTRPVGHGHNLCEVADADIDDDADGAAL